MATRVRRRQDARAAGGRASGEPAAPVELFGVDPAFASRVTTQHYQPPSPIEGVVLHDLGRLVDVGGSFLELARLSSGQTGLPAGFEVRQINYAVLEPGTIKAFHLHLSQSELWFVPPECRALVGLLDVRRSSPTRRASRRLVLGDGQARLLFIPAGVAHGIANLWSRPAQLLYLADQQFDPDPRRCDERRLAWDILGADFWRKERE